METTNTSNASVPYEMFHFVPTTEKKKSLSGKAAGLRKSQVLMDAGCTATTVIIIITPSSCSSSLIISGGPSHCPSKHLCALDFTSAALPAQPFSYADQ